MFSELVTAPGPTMGTRLHTSTNSTSIQNVHCKRASVMTRWSRFKDEVYPNQSWSLPESCLLY